MQPSDAYQKNQAFWDGVTQAHVDSDFYDVASFKEGNTSLRHIELEALGDRVNGKSLLHLQCHFGMDTLSWARQGATVTGVDLSEQAIATARQLAQELAIPATFIQSNIMDLKTRLDAYFDLVYTSYGALCWLHDLTAWADTVAHFLKPGGTFYIVEFHPFLNMITDEGTHLAYPYSSSSPQVFDNLGSYADSQSNTSRSTVEWHHSLADITNALLGAGLELIAMQEFSYSAYPCFSFVEQVGEQRYAAKHPFAGIPMTFSLEARKSK